MTTRKPTEWMPIETAPKDGVRVIGAEMYIHHWGRHKPIYRRRMRVTWWGKTSHVPLYGWCHGRVEDVDLWQPTQWKLLTPNQPSERG